MSKNQNGELVDARWQTLALVTWIVLIAIAGVSILWLAIGGAKIEKMETISEYQQANDFLQTIKKNCDSTQFVLHNGQWKLFAEVCIRGDYCKYDYIPLEDCL